MAGDREKISIALVIRSFDLLPREVGCSLTDVGLPTVLCSVGGLRVLVGRGGVAIWGFGLVHFS